MHSETSTGVVSDIRSLVAACNEADVISVVDAISSLGAVPLETDAWGIDVVVTGSQKALMTPPGLAFASISQRKCRPITQHAYRSPFGTWIASAERERMVTACGADR